jgi:Leucine-rich repeat (LRR) protein
MRTCIIALSGALVLSMSAAAQDMAAFTPESSQESSFDDYMTVKNILKECGISDARLSEVTVMENGRVVFLDLSNKDVSQDGLTILPYAIGNLAELRTLIARDNVIKSIPDALFRLKKLRKLILSSNKILSIPPEIGNLLCLDSLDLRHNRIESLPTEIGKLKKLIYVQLWGNKIKELPASIVGLPALKELYMKDNSLTDLPIGLITMKSLTYIDFQNNQLCKVTQKMEAWLKDKDKQYRALQRCW